MKETIDLEARLEDIWSEHNIEPIPREIIERGYCYCNDVFRDGVKILIFGFNPSFDKRRAKKGNCFYRFSDLMKNPDSAYWSRISGMLADSETNLHEQTAYWDLFSYRETKGQDVLKYQVLSQAEAPCEFVIKHIQLAQEIVEAVKPKLIIVENHHAWAYLGKYFLKEYCAKANGWRWMNYMYSAPEPFPCKYSEVRRIVGIHTGNHPDTNVSGLTSTNLAEGTKVLFMNFIGWYYRQNKKYLQFCPTPEMIAELLK